MRILFLAVHAPDRAPGQRYRFEQYLPYLRERGVQCDHSWVLDGAGAKVLYNRGNFPAKALLGVRTLLKRAIEIPSLRRYDVVFVQREAAFIGGPFVERAAKLLGAKLVYDFDDAIWMRDVSQFNRRFAWLKNLNKVPKIIAMSDLVLAGNQYLADYARRHNPRVTVVPTTIDTDKYVLASAPRPEGPICIGWTGSFSTIRNLETALPALRRVRAKYGDRVRFKVIGDPSFKDEALGVVGLPWRSETEVADLRDVDIGIMPLPDEEWTRGKCGLKGLQYMALAIPTVMSPYGVNPEIITAGQNGFLPGSDDDWVETLSRLIEDPALRTRIGAAGRQRALEAYSVRAWRETYYDLLTGLGGARTAVARDARAASL